MPTFPIDQTIICFLWDAFTSLCPQKVNVMCSNCRASDELCAFTSTGAFNSAALSFPSCSLFIVVFVYIKMVACCVQFSLKCQPPLSSPNSKLIHFFARFREKMTGKDKNVVIY